MPYLHLTSGAAILPADGSDAAPSTLLVAPDERFAELDVADESALLAVVRGTAPVPATGDLGDLVADVIGWGAGTLHESPAPSRAPVDLGACLDGVRRLADVHWQATVHATPVLDERGLLALEPRATLPVHRELGALVAGPLLHEQSAAPALTWADVRFRRLAASPARAQLLRLWETWARDGERHCVVPAPRAWAQAIATFETWAARQAAPLRRHQVVVPLDGAPLSVHPVLPVPAGLMGLTG